MEKGAPMEQNLDISTKAEPVVVQASLYKVLNQLGYEPSIAKCKMRDGRTAAVFVVFRNRSFWQCLTQRPKQLVAEVSAIPMGDFSVRDPIWAHMLIVSGGFADEMILGKMQDVLSHIFGFKVQNSFGITSMVQEVIDEDMNLTNVKQFKSCS